MDGIFAVLDVLVALIGIGAGFWIARKWKQAEPEVQDDGLDEVRAIRDERLRAARSAALEQRAEAEAEARQTLSALEETLHRLVRREERLDSRLDSAISREQSIDTRERTAAQRAEEIGALIEARRAELERIGALGADGARGELLELVAPGTRDAALARADSVFESADPQFRSARSRPVALAAQRTASEMVGEFALVPVPIPREEVKGRIIGREGRNIKTFESLTGVELVIDDAPDAVTLSGFDPYRRELARLALLDLVDDGRIHPGRIEESVKRARDQLGKRLRETGQQAAEAAGIGNVSNELADLLGRLQLVRIDREDALALATRCSGVAAGFAQELRADVRTARRAGLLESVGRAVGREANGSTDVITADLLTRAGESTNVVVAATAPGELVPTVTPEQAAVWLARTAVEIGLGQREESPVRRVDSIENIAAMVDGVQDAQAFQLGTRVRLLIRAPQASDRLARSRLTRGIVERLESSLGPRVGIAIAFIAPRQRSESGDGQQQRSGGGRPPLRGRGGRRS